jgi:general secretion pathway protein I
MYSKSKGFTLLEVLVALAVLAIALSAAIKVTTQNAENTGYLRDRTLAHWVAMNLLTDIQVREEWPALGKKEGTAMMADRKWFWLIKSSKTADKELRRLDVQIFYERKDDEPIAVLVGFINQP